MVTQCVIIKLFQLAGLAILIVGIIAIADEDALKNMLDLIPGIDEISAIVDLTELITNFAIVFIVIGAVAFVIGFLGTFGVICDSKCMTILVSKNNKVAYRAVAVLHSTILQTRRGRNT